MNSNILKAAIFVAGAAIGSVATWQLVKKKYEKIAQEEIDSVKEYYSTKNAVEKDLEKSSAKLKSELNCNKPSIEEIVNYSKITSNYIQEQPETDKELPETDKELPETGNLDDEEDCPGEEEDDEEETEKRSLTLDCPDYPYIINYEDYGQFEDYECMSLNWYADCILADDFDELIEDVEGTIGFDSLTKFGYIPTDPNTIYVRNDAKRMDYEVCKDDREFSEVVRPTPHHMED